MSNPHGGGNRRNDSPKDPTRQQPDPRNGLFSRLLGGAVKVCAATMSLDLLLWVSRHRVAAVLHRAPTRTTSTTPAALTSGSRDRIVRSALCARLAISRTLRSNSV